jgi:prenyltransferase beta subunit
MLQVARLAPRQLGESRDLVARFLCGCQNEDGGFQDRAGRSDLYYTVFGLDSLIALQEPPATAAVLPYLRRFGDGDGLDFVHLACLARAWAAVSPDLDGVPVSRILAGIEACRSADGGYALTPGSAHGSVYASFLALGAYEDLRQPLLDPPGIVRSLGALRARDGGYANRPGDAHGLTAATAAAVTVLRRLDGPLDRHLAMWILDRCHPSGGFLATPTAPMPDLLSTATALHALTILHAPMTGVGERCLDFVDTLWTNRGGFYGHWADDRIDCEYTFYALLAIGHASVAADR